jgi:MTH538 TIR-like domain (DUF1863)
LSFRGSILEEFAGDLEYHPRRGALYLILAASAFSFWYFTPPGRKFTPTPIVFALGAITLLLKGVFLLRKSSEGRKWINYEIKKAWNSGKGLLGVYVHGLKDINGYQSAKGLNPFSGFTVGQKDLASIVKAYDPPYTDSQKTYLHISLKLADWIEEAIEIRNAY